MTDLKTLVRTEMDRAGVPSFGMDDVADRRDRKRRNTRLTAGVVGLAVFVAAVWIVTSVGSFDRTEMQSVPGGAGPGPDVTGPTEPTIAPGARGIVGLPLEGATPSTPERGRLVLHLETAADGLGWTTMWVYADGRVIRVGASAAGRTGFVEQHLTSSWVEILQDRVISTGLFEHDLALLRSDSRAFLTIQARNGTRLVWLTWAAEENGRVPEDAPPATPEQASAIEGIYSLLADPSSWPASAWEDQVPQPFVPSRYQVGLAVWPHHGPKALTVTEREMELLPAPAADLLRQATKLDPASYEMATEDARTLAEALIEAGLEPLAMPMGEDALRFSLEHPDHARYSLFVFFKPVLPHGEAILLGPG